MRFNVAWIDDEYWDVRNPEISAQEFYEEEFKFFFNKYDLEVVLFAYDWDSFDKARKQTNVPLDAVIFDLNFSHSGLPDQDQEADFSGFLYALGFINEQISSPNPIQAYVYTGRDRLLQERALKNKPKNLPDSHIFQKGDIDRLCKQIKDDLEQESHHDMKIRRRFARELDYAREVSPRCEEYLLDSLLFAFSSEGVASSLEIDQKIQLLRDICETCLLTECVKEGILPALEALGEVSNLVDSGTIDSKSGEKYRINKGTVLMDPALSYLFCKVVNKMTNDVKHTKDGLPILIREHIRNTNDLNIYRGMVFMTISILQWYHDNHNLLSQNKVWCTCIDSDNNQTIIDTVSIDSLGDKFVFGGKYKIKKNLKLQYKIGMHLGIISKKKNGGDDYKLHPYYVDFKEHVVVE